MYGTQLKNVDNTEYLGVIINNKLSRSPHINKICRQTLNKMNAISKCLAKCDTNAKKLAYESVIRPNIEYASVVWNPHTIDNINRLEKINKLGKNFVNKQNNGLPYTPDYAIKRRFKNDLKFFHKTHIKEIAVNIKDCYINPTSYTNLRNNSCYNIQRHNYESYKHSYFNRTIVAWNVLDKRWREINDPTIFKESLYDGRMNAEPSYHSFIRRLGISSLIYQLEHSSPNITHH